MKQQVLLTFTFVLFSTASMAQTTETVQSLKRDEIVDILKRTCDYQLRLQAEDKATSKADINYEWVRGAFYTGVMAMPEATGDPKYLQAALDYSERMNYQLAKPDTRHADWQCIGQTFVELYLLKKDPKMLSGAKENMDRQMAAPKPGREEWWWCDALHMAPPVLTRLHAATGDHRYLDYMHATFWDTYDFLYDKDEKLFYRDKGFFNAKTKSGKIAFWSRGNGWVMGGLARLLPYLPKDDFHRYRYEQLFKEMSAKLASIQQPDGLWYPALLDAEDPATSETSGSAFFTFALAWGINNGLLDRATFEPVVVKGWKGLVAAVTPEGKLGHVQRVAAAPGPVRAEDTREYAVGAFLQAGNEILKMMKRAPQSG